MLICILGRQPELGLAELESVYGSDHVTAISDGQIALITAPYINVELGGTIKVAEHIETIPYANFDKLSVHLAKQMRHYLKELAGDGKVKFGLSTYDLGVNTGQVERTALFLKKAIRSAGRSVRVVPNNDVELTSAQVLYNQLTSENGLELVVIRDDKDVIIGRTIKEQDIDAYAKRDHGRPMRDAFVGMLPPKLAQIMIHLATGNAQEMRVLDPFCGTGVVLQESSLFGHAIYGTDLSKKMVDYTRDNIVWLFDTHHIRTDIFYEVADATSHTWQPPIDAVVCEGYLGRPLGGKEPSPVELNAIISECNGIMEKFLKNIAGQLAPGTPLCIAAPAWQLKDGFRHLPVIDDLEALGYARHTFKHVTDDQLLYYRDDQSVARELLVLKKS